MMEVCETFVAATFMSKSKKYASERLAVRRKGSPGTLYNKRLTQSPNVVAKTDDEIPKKALKETDAGENTPVLGKDKGRVKKKKGKGTKEDNGAAKKKEEDEPEIKVEAKEDIKQEDEKEIKEKEENGPKIMGKIREWAAKNEDIISRILVAQSSKQYVQDFSYVLRQEPIPDTHKAFKFVVQEVKGVTTFSQHIEKWTVPDGVPLPVDCDPQKLMYGTDLELMNMTCVSFLDLKRINGQVKVAERYMTMMKDELACSFGMVFVKNFQRVHHILESLRGTESRLAAIEQEVKELNERMEKLFAVHDLRRLDEYTAAYTPHPVYPDSFSDSYQSDSEYDSSYSYSDSEMYSNSF